jgi:MFS family permease
VYYTPEVLEAAGFVEENSLLLATIGVGLVKTLVIFVPLLLMDRTGRRPLLIVSNLGLLAAQLLISLSFLFGGDNTAGGPGGGGGGEEPEPEPEPAASAASKWLAVAGQCAFVAAFSLGVGPLAHVLSSELYPLRIRGTAVGVATFINRATSGMVALSFLSLQRALTPAGAFGLFAAVAAASTLFSVLFVPETMGRSLEELELELGQLRLPCGGGAQGGGGAQRGGGGAHGPREVAATTS